MDANRASRSFALNVAGLSRDDRRPNLHTRPESVSEDGNGQALNVAKEIKSFLRALQKLDEISSRSHGFIKIPTACGETRSALIIIYCILEDNVLVFNSIFQPSALDYDLVIREDMRPMVINHLPPILDNLANALRELRRYLSELPMFRADELLNSLLTMEMNLRTNAQGLEALEEYYNSSKGKQLEGQFKEYDGYAKTTIRHLGEDTFQLTQNLQTFLNEGISVVEKEEKDESKMMLNLSSVATLFSATTAAALQIALTGDLNLLVELAVCFWFISLILSVAVALNVLFGLAVKQTRSKSLRKPVPLWITIWIDNSPPLFLAFSAACFAIGLTLFVYASSKRAFFTKIAFTVVFVVSIVGLCIAGLWELFTGVLSLWHKLFTPLQLEGADTFYRLKRRLPKVIFHRTIVRTTGDEEITTGYAVPAQPQLTFYAVARVVGLVARQRSKHQADLENGGQNAVTQGSRFAISKVVSIKEKSTMPISILQFSPDGKHLVIMEQDGTWEFYDTQGRPSQIPPNIKRAEQLAWVDRGVLCVFTRERILLWGLEHSRVVNIEQWKSGFQAAVRLPQDDVLLLVQKSIAYELRFNGIWRDKHDFGGVSIEQIAPIKGTTFLLCAGTMKRRQSSSHPETECHIIIYNTANKQIYYRLPFAGRKSEVIHFDLSRNQSRLLIVFKTGAHLCEVEVRNGPRIRLIMPLPSPTRIASGPATERRWLRCRFGGGKDEYILGIMQSGDLFSLRLRQRDEYKEQWHKVQVPSDKRFSDIVWSPVPGSTQFVTCTLDGDIDLWRHQFDAKRRDNDGRREATQREVPEKLTQRSGEPQDETTRQGQGRKKLQRQSRAT